MAGLVVTNTTKNRTPRLPFLRLKDAILGKKYELSVVIVGDALSRKRNTRHKHTPANILSFPYSQSEGEILLNPRQAKREYKKFKMTYQMFLVYLVIHGMLHLKGLRHGSTMSQAEARLLRRFSN
ncbi:rRNA maturation RNase YbeY [Candidatus Kaiserbacteria bacterium RIFCSPHIGHO2_01_FULL_49_13]|uniref:rRNA maturation RNase YbeY n=1 Tax=Candidatus Kaiserbacteria bacterium RIFCSPHIGHO2_01_FULL_49_13 TaxID=1798477 RepID=A0A1F6CEL7_9BACT|nr:MAG: rRNA maturation RNase YbeY [Candidatus Kaiserbacteria bacterium RIFCSPHIGHO2_01_FULL_49_13]